MTTTDSIGPELAAVAVLQYGWACREDDLHVERSGGKDGWHIRDAMQAVAALIRGEIGIVEFRARVDLCPAGGEHWTEYCNEACTPKPQPRRDYRILRIYSGDMLIHEAVVPDASSSYSPGFDLRAVPNLRIEYVPAPTTT